MKRRKLMNGIKYIVLIVLACIYLIPIIMMLLGSVKDPAQAMLFDLSWPETFHWDNYSYVIEEGNILNGYKQSADNGICYILHNFIRWNCRNYYWQKK